MSLVPHQDTGSSLVYWVKLNDDLGSAKILSAKVDAALSNEITVFVLGINNAAVTDEDSVTYPAGTLVGLLVSGGSEGKLYRIPLVIQCDSNETIDGSIPIQVLNFHA